MKYKILSLCMAFFLLCQPFFTVSATRANGNSASSAMKFLSAMGIMEDDPITGEFWNDTPVKRKELARIVCSITGVDIYENSVSVFSDVSGEDRAYAETVVRNGYMLGCDNNMFKPNSYVSVTELLVVMVRVLGCERIANVKGGYPDGYMAVARDLGILGSSVKSSSGDYARRIDVANIIYDAMHADLPQLAVISGEYSSFSSAEGKTFLSEYLDIYKFSGIFEKNKNTSLNDSEGTADDTIVVGSRTFRDPQGLSEDYFGCNVNVYVKGDGTTDFPELIYLETANKNKTITISGSDEPKAKGYELSYYSSSKRKELKISPIVSLVYNGKFVPYDSEYVDIDNGFLKLVDNDNDNIYDVILVTEYETYVSNRVNVDDETISLKHGKSSIVLKEHNYDVFLDGNKISLSEISDGSVLSVAVSEGSASSNKVYRIDVCTDKALGKIESFTKKSDGTYVKIGSKTYKMSKYAEKAIEGNYIPKWEAGSSGQFYLDIQGDIIYYSIGDGGMSVGYLIGSYKIEDGFSKGLNVRLYSVDGMITDYEVTDKLSVNDSKYKVEDILDNAQLINKFQTAQLVQYEANEDKLKSIEFASDGYDTEKFSLDVSASMLCTSVGATLDYKYGINAETMVFRVPSVSKSSSRYLEEMSNPDNYTTYGSSYFGGGNWYNAKYYDINEDGEIKYVVITWNPQSRNVWEWHALLLVDEVCSGVDENGDEIETLIGYNENGVRVEYTTLAKYEDVLTDSTLGRKVKRGDVVQFRLDNNNNLAEILLTHNSEGTDYYEPVYLEETKTNAAVYKVFGKCRKTTGNSMSLVCGEIEGTTPMEADFYTVKNGNAIFRYNSETDKTEKIEFEEIESGDNVFVCSNRSKNRMIVIYE